jgi:hypothetical protein
MTQRELQGQLLSAPGNTAVILTNGVRCVAECAMRAQMRQINLLGENASVRASA